MKRKDLYNKVKELHLEAEIKRQFQRDFTKVSNIDIQTILEKHVKGIKPSTKEKELPKNVEKAIVRLVSTLQANKLLTAEESNDILGLL